MPLTLVTGPANSEKARAVLDGYRAALSRGERPILVVPTFADVERYRRELADGNVVFGAQVVRFAWLVDEAARRAGMAGSPVGPLVRERLAAAAVAQAPLRALRASASTPGFPRAVLRLVDELEESRISPSRLAQALRAWAGEDLGRQSYGAEVAALYGGYRRALDRLGRLDGPLRAAAALDALREHPGRWGATPVFFYGFDDLSTQQRDAVQTLAATGAEVTVSLAYEPGRLAFAGRATTFVELIPVADRHVELEARAEHYAPAARGALHHLERRLFEVAPERTLLQTAPAAPGGPDPGDAITLLEGGGERAELELVAAEVAGLIHEEGYAPEEIAVVVRSPAAVAPLIAQVFAELEVPVALDRRVAFGHTPLGRGLVALLRCALLDGTAADLLAWLRTPGLLQRPELADALEGAARRHGARTAQSARELWEADNWGLDPIDRLRQAQRRGPAALLERLTAELGTLFAAPRRRAAQVLTGPAALDAQVLAAGRRALDELAALAAGHPALAPAPVELAHLLATLEVPVGDRPARGAVAVADPLSLRARRVRALFCCRLQEASFPAPARPEPFLGDAERAEIARASGLRLRRHEDTLGAERYLFYATVSRPEQRLYLSWHDADDEGDPAVRSFFVADVVDLFGPTLWDRRRTRALGQVGWPRGAAPTRRERLRGEAAAAPRRAEPPIAPLSDAAVLAALGERPTWSASAIEQWAGCPVRWFVERVLHPEGLVPDPELMVRGALAHCVLEATLRGLRERTGSARVGAASLPAARELLLAALERLRDDPRLLMSRDPGRQRAMARRLEADLLRYVEHAAHAGSELEPAALEVGFGGPDDEHPPLQLGDGVALRGRIDRVDVGPAGEAIVYDYKGRRAIDHSKWVTERKFQVALYVLAARDVLGLEPVGGLYQPLGGTEQRPRGLLRDDADPGLAGFANDRRDAEGFTAVIDAVVGEALAAVAEIRAGALVPRPDTCAYEGGCAYPTICRCEAA